MGFELDEVVYLLGLKGLGANRIGSNSVALLISLQIRTIFSSGFSLFRSSHSLSGLCIQIMPFRERV